MRVADDELVPKLCRGDAQAFRQLVDQYGDDLFRLARSMVGSEADACDVVQEALVGAFRRVSTFDGRSALKTWLVRVLFNHASKARRSRRRRQALSLSAVESSGGPADDGVPPASSRGPSEPAVDARIDALAMLQTLSEDHRQVLVLREIEQLSYQEIAQVLDVPVGTVESRLYRARQDMLRRFPGYVP